MSCNAAFKVRGTEESTNEKVARNFSCQIESGDRKKEEF